MTPGMSGRGSRKSSKSGRKDQHFPGAVVAKVIVALPWVERTGPVLEVGELALGLLRE